MPKPVKLQSSSKQKSPARQQYMCDGKQSQSTKFIKSLYGDHKCQSTMFSDKNCQETKLIHMWSLKPEKSSIKWLPKPAVPDQYKKLCSDKNCQSTRCYRKKHPVRPMCGDDKNCQSPKKHVKSESEETYFSCHKWSVPKTDGK